MGTASRQHLKRPEFGLPSQKRTTAIALAAILAAFAIFVLSPSALGQTPTQVPGATSTGVVPSSEPQVTDEPPASGANETAAPAESPGSDESEEPTATPAPFSKEGAWAKGLNDFITALGGVVVALVVGFLALVLGGIVAYRLLTLVRRPRELVVPAFVNGTGDATIEPLLVGENVRLRERLAVELENTRRKIEFSRRYTDFAPGGNERSAATAANISNASAPLADVTPLPAKQLDPRVDQLAAALSAAAPEPTKALFGLLSFAFPAKGSQITATVQRHPGPPDVLGLSVEITDIDSAPASMPLTWWESKPTLAGSTPVGGSPSRIGEPERRRLLRRAVNGLVASGRYADAVRYGRLLARLDPSNDDLAREIALNEARLSRQIRARAHFDTGSLLQSAGNSEAAITEFQAAYTGEKKSEIRSAWRIALGIVRGSKGQANADLGRLYRPLNTRLVPQVIQLLENAVEDGAKDAAKELAEFKQEVAKQLAISAISLEGLGYHDDASVLSAAAGGLDPDGEEVKQAASVIAPEPATDEATAAKKGRALAAVARVLENKGAWTEARAKYEAALGESPDVDEARDGLARVISAQLDSSQRLTPLIAHAAKWAAYSLAEREWITNAQRGRQSNKEIAKIHNYFGMLFQSHGWSGPDLWLRLASFELRTAIDLDPTFYEAHQNLGDTLANDARRSGAELAAARWREAVLHYDEALSLLRPTPNERAVRRININKATVLLLMSERDVDLVRASRQALRAAHVVNWKPESIVEAGTSYDLACWHSLAIAKHVRQGSRDIAIHQLAMALALDQSWSYAAQSDDYLESIRKVVPRMLRLIDAGRGNGGSVADLVALAEKVAQKVSIEEA